MHAAWLRQVIEGGEKGGEDREESGPHAGTSGEVLLANLQMPGL